MPSRKAPALAAVLIVISLILSACQPQSTPEAPTPVLPPTQLPQTDPAQEQPSLPPVPTPARSLVICLGQEPDTLYPFGSSAPSMWSVLEAVYDGPFDMLEYGSATRHYAERALI
jgi:ABC-type transport system substrate-binding protein